MKLEWTRNERLCAGYSTLGEADFLDLSRLMNFKKKKKEPSPETKLQNRRNAAMQVAAVALATVASNNAYASLV